MKANGISEESGGAAGHGPITAADDAGRPVNSAATRNHRPRVLHVSRRVDLSALSARRRTAYSRAECEVTLVRHLDEVLRACARHAFDVVVIDRSIPFEDERRIVTIIRACVPEATVLTDLRQGR